MYIFTMKQSMGSFAIPSEVKDGFISIINLTSTELSELNQLVKDAEVGQGVEVLSENNTIGNLNKERIKSILRSLFSLVNIFDSTKKSIDDFAADFAESFRESFSEISNIEEGKLKQNLIQLLNSFSSIKLTVKARNLIIENLNNFTESRIISDIRIVFNDDNRNEKQQCALIVHQLNIKYFSGSSKNNLFSISLDSADLKKLKKTIDRAIEKDISIKENNHELKFIDFS